VRISLVPPPLSLVSTIGLLGLLSVFFFLFPQSFLPSSRIRANFSTSPPSLPGFPLYLVVKKILEIRSFTPLCRHGQRLDFSSFNIPFFFGVDLLSPIFHAKVCFWCVCLLYPCPPLHYPLARARDIRIPGPFTPPSPKCDLKK